MSYRVLGRWRSVEGSRLSEHLPLLLLLVFITRQSASPIDLIHTRRRYRASLPPVLAPTSTSTHDCGLLDDEVPRLRQPEASGPLCAASTSRRLVRENMKPKGRRPLRRCPACLVLASIACSPSSLS